MKNNFNILITGAGGQGLITLVDILSKAILIDKKDVVASELHGLSQRGGAVAVFVSMSLKNRNFENENCKNKVYSTLFKRGDTDLILGLELLEGLRGCEFTGIKTKILVNNYFLPFAGTPSQEEILVKLKKIGKNNFKLVEASKTCKEKLEKEILAGIYFLGYAIYNGFIPIKPESVLMALEETVPERFLEINRKAFELANIQ